MIGWIAEHTGLPSLHITNLGAVYAGDRLLINPDTVPALVSDPLAPLGTPVTYRQGSSTVTLTAADPGYHMVASSDGRLTARIALLGDDGTSQGSGLSLFEPDSDHEDIPQWGRVPSPSGTFACRTAGIYTARMLAMVKSRGPLVSFHSPDACEIPGCDIPPVRAFVAGDASYQRTGTTLEARRVWSIPWTGYTPSGWSAPVVTWGEYAAASAGWTTESYVEICQRIAGMP